MHTHSAPSKPHPTHQLGRSKHSLVRAEHQALVPQHQPVVQSAGWGQDGFNKQRLRTGTRNTLRGQKRRPSGKAPRAKNRVPALPVYNSQRPFVHSVYPKLCGTSESPKGLLKNISGLCPRQQQMRILAWGGRVLGLGAGVQPAASLVPALPSAWSPPNLRRKISLFVLTHSRHFTA